jgi:hypothetical protein
MNNLSTAHLEKIENFFKEIELNHLYIGDYLNADDFEYLDFSNAFVEILDLLDEKNAFDIEIIYYSEAMKYLTLHDTSLNESIELAVEYGIELKNINSELLASLLASKITREAFWGYRDEIENFFTNFDVLEFTDK